MEKKWKNRKKKNQPCFNKERKTRSKQITEGQNSKYCQKEWRDNIWVPENGLWVEENKDTKKRTTFWKLVTPNEKPSYYSKEHSKSIKMQELHLWYKQDSSMMWNLEPPWKASGIRLEAVFFFVTCQESRWQYVFHFAKFTLSTLGP